MIALWTPIALVVARTLALVPLRAAAEAGSVLARLVLARWAIGPVLPRLVLAGAVGVRAIRPRPVVALTAAEELPPARAAGVAVLVAVAITVGWVASALAAG